MWSYIYEKFSRSPSQLKIVKKMFSVGIRVAKLYDEPVLMCGDIEIRPNTLAKATGTDRRSVMSVIDRIIKDETLYPVFSQLEPVANLWKASSKLGYGVIEILPESASKPGIIAGVSTIIARRGISIRQVIVDDPELVEDPKAVVVTEQKVPPDIIQELKSVEGVRAITIM
ncbi:ACT domain-containing protein [Thermoplasma sp.]|uniref:ACT domain-containing protein n=1 Tax=Thermoplasma sp. TaxID=1973142 RepID=UPI00127CF07A|nr:ACT domain-containing protein [Thermoplasma sp.]KAA8922951.1 MAG: ACT domain-containing protein [Thermoplasma sp.]